VNRVDGHCVWQCLPLPLHVCLGQPGRGELGHGGQAQTTYEQKTPETFHYTLPLPATGSPTQVDLTDKAANSIMRGLVTS
jgi:hypothetical protein